MIRIIYLSSSSYYLDEKNLVDLYKISQENNLKNNITGLFIYYNQDIFQVLEGPKDAVNSLFKKICKDERHTALILLSEEEIETRYFPNWRMGFYVDGYADIQKNNSIELFKRTNLENADTKKLQILLESFLENHTAPLVFV